MMSMMDVVRDLREREKQQIEESRRKQRADAVNSVRRGLGFISRPKYSVDNVVNIASKLKTKGAVNVKDLLILMHTLSEHEDNISSFFKVPGALPGLVKEMTGTDAHKQLVAIGCICNLALSPSKSCLLLAKSSGMYLTMYLQSQNRHILELCTWTLGNLAASGKKTATILEAQGFSDNILCLLDKSYESKIIESTAYALSHMIYSNPNLLNDSCVEHITEGIIACYERSDQVLWLIYLLSDKTAAQSVFYSKNFFEFVITELLALTVKFFASDLHIINCLIRTAANLVVFQPERCLHVVYSEIFSRLIDALFSNGNTHITKDTLWLLGNIYNVYPESTEKTLLFNKLSFTLNNFTNSIE